MFAYANSEHFAGRINGFLSPEIDPRTQLGYATNAIQEGGFFGVGVGEGSVKWSLPDAHTDFIIAVAAEEFGLLLCIVILALFLIIVLRSLVRLVGERDPFIRLAGTGLAVLLGMQAMINIGVAVRLLPAKGMTLPPPPGLWIPPAWSSIQPGWNSFIRAASTSSVSRVRWWMPFWLPLALA